MSDLTEIMQTVGRVLGIGYWLIDVDRRTVYWPRGLGRRSGGGDDTGHRTSSLDKVTAFVDEADRGRFRAFLADLIASDGEVRIIEVTITTSGETRLPVRLGGRKIGAGREIRIVGLVEVIARQRESDRLARSLGHIVEALFISSESGIVILDSDLHVRRLNRNALDLFGISDSDEADGSYSAAIEAKLPPHVREHLQEAIGASCAVSGTLSLGGLGATQLSWRANPWGAGPGDMSGVVMVFERKRLKRAADLAEVEIRSHRPQPVSASAVGGPPTNGPSPAPVVSVSASRATMRDEAADRRHRALEWVKHPIVLVSISSCEIVFANRAARELFHLPANRRWFVENLYDISGFSGDPDPATLAATGGLALRLRFGARVGRMSDYDEDLLFVEYHTEMPHPRIVVPPSVHSVAR